MNESDLSPHQLERLDTLEEAVLEERRMQTGEPLVLTGPAGSGKTTLLKSLIGRMRRRSVRVAVIAPTGRAAMRATEVAGVQARTVHAASFASVLESEDGTPVFLDPRAACSAGELLICDEASMIDQRQDEVLRTQLPRGSVLLYVGDKEQLPPVAGPWGPNFDAPTAELEEIHRQAADNPIVQISALVRTGGQLPRGRMGEEYERGEVSGLDVVAAWMRERVENRDDTFLLTWSNKTRQALNRLVRRSLGHTQPIQPGERLMVLQNNYSAKLANGCILAVKDVIPFEETRAARTARSGDWERENLVGVVFEKSPWSDGQTERLVAPSLLGLDLATARATLRSELTEIRDRDVLLVDYGYACTVHKAQGSQAEHVGFVIDSTAWWMARKDAAFARRLIYTAITRSTHSLRVFDVK